METKKLINTSLLLAVIMITSCSKSEFLNEKPQKSLIIPNTLEHFQAMMDRDADMNGLAAQGATPQLGESGADNFYLLDANFNTNLRPQMQNYYIWTSPPYDGVNVLDWEYPYRAILFANSVLEGLQNIERTEAENDQFNYINGQALFHRAHFYYQLVQVFAPPYDIEGSNDALSIPLRLSADINEPLRRSTVQETYDLILNDLKRAIPFLTTEPIYKHRPSKQAVYALLARTFLTMCDYEKAKLYADSCLSIQDDLLDYNLVNPTSNYPFGGNSHNSLINQEVIFISCMLSSQSQNYPITFNNALVDSTLYESYHPDDLRRSIFFVQQPIGHRFKGTYNFLTGVTAYFSGLAVDEVLLTRAESNARLGNVEQALNDLNRLLTARWREDSYTPYEGLSAAEALSTILEERRKQLLFRGLRWSDIRRLNQEGHGISVTRNINGQTHILTPTDSRWVWPFPLEVTVQ